MCSFGSVSFFKWQKNDGMCPHHTVSGGGKSNHYGNRKPGREAGATCAQAALLRQWVCSQGDSLGCAALAVMGVGTPGPTVNVKD